MISEEEYKIEKEQMEDKYLRLLADFDNYKKNNARRIEIIKENAQRSILDAIIPILDDFVIMVNHEYAFNEEGKKLVLEKLDTSIRNANIEPYGEVGDTFTDDLYEAISLTETNKVNSGCVSEVFKRGYKFNNKIIRYAKVCVEK